VKNDGNISGHKTNAYSNKKERNILGQIKLNKKRIEGKAKKLL